MRCERIGVAVSDPSGVPGEGASHALQLLDSLGTSREAWDQERIRSRGVGTQLWPLGVDRTNRLIRHAYAQTVANLLSVR